MTLQTATISGQFLRPDLQKSVSTVVINAATVGSRLKFNGMVIDGKVAVDIQADGNATATLPLLPQTGIEPADAVWRIVSSGAFGKSEFFFNLTGDTTWDQLFDVSNQPITETIQAAAEAARDAALAAAAAAEAVGTTNDTVMASRLNDTTSASYQAEHGPVLIDLCRAPYNATAGADITTALQNAINAIATAQTSGEIYFSKPGVYLVNGALQTGTVTGTAPTVNYTYNGQILFPPVTQASGKPLAITIRGTAAPFKGGTVNKAGGTILRTNLTSGWMFDAIPVYSAYNAQYPWTNVSPVFKNIVLESAATDPQHGMVKAITCQTFKMEDTLVSCLGAPTATLSTGTIEAVSLPQVQNDGDVTLRDCNIRGFGLGLRLTEHLELSSTRIGFCGVAFVSNGSAHLNKFVRANVENCPTVFKCETIINGPVSVEGHLDWECSVVTPVAFMDYASGFSSMRGSLDVWFSFPGGSLPITTGTATNDSSLWRDFNLRNIGQGGRGSLDQHPSDEFRRAVANPTTGTPGLTWPTLHRWLKAKGSFKITGAADAVGALSSTNGTTESQALLMARNGGESRLVNSTFVLGTGYHCAQWLNYLQTGSHAFFFLAVDLAGTTLKLNAFLGSVTANTQQTLASATVAVASGQTHTISSRILNDATGLPTHVTVYLDGVATILYRLTSAQTAALSGLAMDGLSLYEQNTTCTKFWVTGASPDAPTSTVTGFGFPYTVDPGIVRSSDNLGMAANNAVYMRVAEGGTISKVGLSVAVQSGNISVAAYSNTGIGRSSNPGTLLASSGAVACPAAGYQEISLGASVTLAPGDWLAISADNATVRFLSLLGTANTNGLGAGRQYQQTTAHPLPSTPASLTATAGNTFVLVGV